MVVVMMHDDGMMRDAVAHDVMTLMNYGAVRRHLLAVVVMHRPGRRHAGRDGERDGCGKRQGEQFQGLPSQSRCSRIAFGHRPLGPSSPAPVTWA
jgi:hypothetical protein